MLKWAICGIANFSGKVIAMHFEFLIEDQSGKILIELLMKKICLISSNTTYKCTAYHGIGGFTRKNTVKETRTGKLLNDLATRLRAFNKTLRHMPSAVFIVMDNDDRDTAQFREELNKVAVENNINIDYVFCIAIEEMEAWLLGDSCALMQAYPSARRQALRTYQQDSICGTWELLADVVYPGGVKKFKKNCPTYCEKGKYKTIWAQKIGTYMDIDSNSSPSFNSFIQEIQSRLPPQET